MRKIESQDFLSHSKWELPLLLLLSVENYYLFVVCAWFVPEHWTADVRIDQEFLNCALILEHHICFLQRLEFSSNLPRKWSWSKNQKLEDSDFLSGKHREYFIIFLHKGYFHIWLGVVPLWISNYRKYWANT